MLRYKTRPKFNNIGRKTLIRIHYNMDQSEKLWQPHLLHYGNRRCCSKGGGRNNREAAA
jgi:hypothetical protein